MRLHVRDLAKQLSGDIAADTLRVFVNGIDRTNDCFEFDTQENWAKCFLRDENGCIVNGWDDEQKKNLLLTETYRGRVCVVIGDASDLKIEPIVRKQTNVLNGRRIMD